MTGCKKNKNLESEGVSSYVSEESAANEEDTSPLRVLIDLEYGSDVYVRLQDELENYDKEYVRGKWEGISLQAKIEDMGGPSSVEIEIAPIRENERDVYLTSLRTEMMSGGGPDVFVCRGGTGFHEKETNGKISFGEWIESEPLFKFPQQAMKRNMFLALEDYIKKAQFMEWEKLTPVVMDAGKTEKGQFLLPMTYTVATTAFRESDVEHTPSRDMKWEDMLSDGPHMPLAAIAEVELIGNGLAPFADYEHDKLAVSEEEMLRYYGVKLDNRKKYNEESGVPYIGFDLKVMHEYDLSIYDESFNKDDPITLVPLYSRNGGYMATVTSFAGINANTKHPDEAFWVVDYLLGEECQRSILYTFMTTNQAVPTLEGLMTSGKAVSTGFEDDNGKPKGKMPDNLYEQFCAVRDNISFADFATPLDREFQKLYFDLLEPSTKSREDVIHDAYMRMSMELAES
ncbi:extracellular solute-binding protein [Acutalibacter muris]|nr:extracellular solute-binding protein [Acutalibacter muris]QQR30080.1 extracellular solute-binding protein [Acutalibacter muris]